MIFIASSSLRNVMSVRVEGRATNGNHIISCPSPYALNLSTETTIDNHEDASDVIQMTVMRHLFSVTENANCQLEKMMTRQPSKVTKSHDVFTLSAL